MCFSLKRWKFRMNWPDFFEEERTAKKNVTSKLWKRVLITVVIGAFIPPCWAATAAEWRVCTLTDAHSSAQSTMNVIVQYSETRAQYKLPSAVWTRPLHSMVHLWNPQSGWVSRGCQVRVVGVFFTQAYSFFWCHVKSNATVRLWDSHLM